MNNVHSLLVVLFASLAAATYAQPQWRFHLAFEDATGAKDTLWFIWDETATEGWNIGDVDYHLGEGRVEMDLDVFNVYLGNWDGDSTKTVAIPYTSFPWHSSEPIDAFNYEYPITIRWDRSLFHAPYLPDPDTINFAVLNGMYFYLHANQIPPGVYSILEEDSVVVGLDALWSPLFPTTLLIGHQGDPSRVDHLAGPAFKWTNDGERLLVHGGKDIAGVEVLGLDGRLLAGQAVKDQVTEWPIGHWPSGMYIIRVRTHQHHFHHARFIHAH